MSFFVQGARQQVMAQGPKDAAICLIGEAGGAEEARTGKPFQGPAGSVLDSCLRSAQISRFECFIHNVVDYRPDRNNIDPFWNTKKKTFTAKGWDEVDRLRDELKGNEHNIYVALGEVAWGALSLSRGESLPRTISKQRGYITETWHGKKLLPTLHPANALRQYLSRYLIAGDLKKVKRESSFPEIIRPNRELIFPDTYPETVGWLEEIAKWPKLAIDIEVYNYEVSCIGFAKSPQLGVSVSLYEEESAHRLSLEQECHVWLLIEKVFNNPHSIKIFQNGIFDMYFMALRNNIITYGDVNYLEDTMIKHHLVYPDLPKGLEFLVSLYCGSQEYYKDMVKFNNIKKES